MGSSVGELKLSCCWESLKASSWALSHGATEGEQELRPEGWLVLGRPEGWLVLDLCTASSVAVLPH